MNAMLTQNEPIQDPIQYHGLSLNPAALCYLFSVLVVVMGGHGQFPSTSSMFETFLGVSIVMGSILELGILISWAFPKLENLGDIKTYALYHLAFVIWVGSIIFKNL